MAWKSNLRKMYRVSFYFVVGLLCCVLLVKYTMMDNALFRPGSYNRRWKAQLTEIKDKYEELVGYLEEATNGTRAMESKRRNLMKADATSTQGICMKKRSFHVFVR